MPIISFSIMWTIIIDVVAWVFFHLLVSVFCFLVPLRYFQRSSSLFKIAAWENSGHLWQRLFCVKKWKGAVPDGARLFKFGYEKKALHGVDNNTLQRFAAETKRAELAHWLSILPAPLFFFWNPVWAGWVMILYALFFNIPLIIVQRYNRARLEMILDRLRMFETKNRSSKV
ncbi:glycosyl-4,4'-diaponeurosporenoate acyltransferase CrtO family protein [Metabacillus halosaccharovorans]|uniref:Glycosyl-4,4'-diaponeurosporenoate acyltransferase n=1 Tax=Metabacillus halosaccharovorans TaxID=930124 RepID=A0ABT3DHL3_9BACI|nr:glycosyl-4,4'-diaponeurosporenoate acyltransferase [Metabacillus halosaccharovorans]MCV9886558.1 glycosyl-4,4'-diaponeurosporenoate acyltransferase [Metabacillus halosaccharovorans]